MTIRWMAIAIAIVGCGETPGDGASDSFLNGGKGDTFGIEENSPEALGVLRVANELSREQLKDDLGIAARSAKWLTEYRNGDDGIHGTGDDNPFDSLVELDSVRYIGPITFGRLLDYAEANGFIVYPSGDMGVIPYGGKKVVLIDEVIYDDEIDVYKIEFKPNVGDEVYLRMRRLNEPDFNRRVGYWASLMVERDGVLEQFDASPEDRSSTYEEFDPPYGGAEDLRLWASIRDPADHYYMIFGVNGAGIDTLPPLDEPLEVEISVDVDLPYPATGWLDHLDVEEDHAPGVEPRAIRVSAALNGCLAAADTPRAGISISPYGSSSPYGPASDVYRGLNAAWGFDLAEDGRFDLVRSATMPDGETAEVTISGEIVHDSQPPFYKNGDSVVDDSAGHVVIDEFFYTIDGTDAYFLPESQSFTLRHRIGASCYGW